MVLPPEILLTNVKRLRLCLRYQVAAGVPLIGPRTRITVGKLKAVLAEIEARPRPEHVLVILQLDQPRPAPQVALQSIRETVRDDGCIRTSVTTITSPEREMLARHPHQL